MTSNEEITVIVTGVGGGSHGCQVMKALRLSSNPYRIIGTDMSPMSQGLYEADEGHVIPSASEDAYVPTILDLAREYDADVLVHGSEPELVSHSRHRDEFADEGLYLPINPHSVIELCNDKWETMRLLEQEGFTTPDSVLVESDSDVSAVDFLPAVVKPVSGGGSSGIFIAQSRDDLAFFCKHLLRQDVTPLVQEYVGTPNDEYTVGVLTDDNGEIINSIAVERYIRGGLSNHTSVRNDTGDDSFSDTLAVSSGISQGKIGRYPEITERCEEIAEIVGAKGPVNIQCRYVEGTLYPFEINPRFSGTTSLRAMVGFNGPDLLIQHRINDELIEKRFDYEEGAILRGVSETYTAELKDPYDGIPDEPDR